MFLNLAKTFIHKAAYGFFGNASFALTQASNIEPQGDPLDTYLWSSLGVGALTGLAGLLKRIHVFDKAKI